MQSGPKIGSHWVPGLSEGHRGHNFTLGGIVTKKALT